MCDRIIPAAACVVGPAKGREKIMLLLCMWGRLSPQGGTGGLVFVEGEGEGLGLVTLSERKGRPGQSQGSSREGGGFPQA